MWSERHLFGMKPWGDPICYSSSVWLLFETFTGRRVVTSEEGVELEIVSLLEILHASGAAKGPGIYPGGM